MAETRATTLRFQSIANGIVRVLLHMPLVSLGIGSRLIELRVVGRKSGNVYRLPVAYTRDGGDLLVGTPFAWGKNLRTGEPIGIVLKGKRVLADVVVSSDEAGVVAAYATMSKDNSAFASFNRIAIGTDGVPDAGDLHAAWAGGARAFRLTPR